MGSPPAGRPLVRFLQAGSEKDLKLGKMVELKVQVSCRSTMSYFWNSAPVSGSLICLAQPAIFQDNSLRCTGSEALVWKRELLLDSGVPNPPEWNVRRSEPGGLLDVTVEAQLSLKSLPSLDIED